MSKITELILAYDFTYIALTQDKFITPSLKYFGTHGPTEMQLLEELIQEDDVVLDVGANIGTHTLHFARRAKRGKVLAFEPQVFVQQILSGNVALNGFTNVQVFQCAVGKEVGQVLLPKAEYSTLRNYGGLDIREHALKPREELSPVQLLTIDSLQLSRVNLMKVDVESMEEDVLRGSFQTIFAQQPVLYLEADREVFRRELLSFIHTLGYVAWLHRPPMIPADAVPNISNEELQKHFDFMKTCIAVNLLCVPRASKIVTPLFAERHGLKLVSN